jgi:hypothetical protein
MRLRGIQDGTNLWQILLNTTFSANRKYDVAGNSWSTKSTPAGVTKDNGGLTASAVKTSFIYVVGGFDSGGNRQATTYSYGTLTDVWTTATSYPYAWAGGLAFTFYSSNFMHFLSGSNNGGTGLKDNYRFDGTTFTVKTSCINGHSQGFGNANNTIGYAAGGFNSVGPVHRHFESYDPVGDTWTLLNDLPSPPFSTLMSSI